MFGTYCVVGLLGLVAIGLVGWVVAGVVDEHRKSRAAALMFDRFQRSTRDQGR